MKIRFAIAKIAIASFLLLVATFQSMTFHKQSIVLEDIKVLAASTFTYPYKTENDLISLSNLGTALAIFEENGLPEYEGSSMEESKSISVLCNEEIAISIEEYKKEQQRIAFEKKQAAVKTEMASRPGMVGRLVIPSANIDVALFACGVDVVYSQAVCDAADSATYRDTGAGSIVIADHNNQDFRTLHQVTVGTKAQILTGDSTINIVCTSAFNGHNTEYDLVDEAGNSCTTIAPFVMYTCRDTWQNIFIAGFTYA